MFLQVSPGEKDSISSPVNAEAAKHTRKDAPVINLLPVDRFIRTEKRHNFWHSDDEKETIDPYLERFHDPDDYNKEGGELYYIRVKSEDHAVNFDPIPVAKADDLVEIARVVIVVPQFEEFFIVTHRQVLERIPDEYIGAQAYSVRVAYKKGDILEEYQYPELKKVALTIFGKNPQLPSGAGQLLN